MFLVLLYLVVGFGRVAHGRTLVDQAAASAARSASLAATPSAAAASADRTAAAMLSQAGVSCGSFIVTVDIGAFRPGGRVTTTVRCTAELSDLALAGLPGSTTLQATSTSPLESFRDFGS